MSTETRALYREAKRLGRIVLAADSQDMTLAEFAAEPVEKQRDYVRWLEAEARDVRREARYS